MLCADLVASATGHQAQADLGECDSARISKALAQFSGLHERRLGIVRAASCLKGGTQLVQRLRGTEVVAVGAGQGEDRGKQLGRLVPVLGHTLANAEGIGDFPHQERVLQLPGGGQGKGVGLDPGGGVRPAMPPGPPGMGQLGGRGMHAGTGGGANGRHHDGLVLIEPRQGRFLALEIHDAERLVGVVPGAPAMAGGNQPLGDSGRE
jgi:hypothetical protein